MMKTNLPLHWHFKCPHRQEGAVLVISLMLLVILTMLGISAIDSTKLETRMAKNTQIYNEAFQMAEAGLVQASNRLINRISDTSSVFVIPECQFAPISEFILTRGEEAAAKEIVGKAELGIMTLPQMFGKAYLHFVAQSKGYNGEQGEENVINVTLEGGMKRIVPEGYLETSFIDEEEGTTAGIHCEY
jgi:Tfp pilus assembly protein PilX